MDTMGLFWAYFGLILGRGTIPLRFPHGRCCFGPGTRPASLMTTPRRMRTPPRKYSGTLSASPVPPRWLISGPATATADTPTTGRGRTARRRSRRTRRCSSKLCRRRRHCGPPRRASTVRGSAPHGAAMSRARSDAAGQIGQAAIGGVLDVRAAARKESVLFIW